MSADIVGSTALKQSPMGGSPGQLRHDWFTKIQGFYFEAQDAFLNECEEAMEEENGLGSTPKMWKTVGDEVIFTKTLANHHELIQTLHCWEKATKRMCRFIKKGDNRLDVKSTAWLAGFPFRNAEVVTSAPSEHRRAGDQDWFLESGDLIDKFYRSDDSAGIEIDFIGPSIDIGFRLSSFATSRKFVVSIEIAYILSIANPKKAKFDHLFQVYYDGAKSLKGVLGGVDYPIFWLDFSDDNSLDRIEDGIAEKNFVNRDELRKYCTKFFSEFGQYVFPPFIISDDEFELNEMPKWYEKEHEKLYSKYEEMLKDRRAREDSILNSPPEDEKAGESDAVNESRLTDFLDRRNLPLPPSSPKPT